MITDIGLKRYCDCILASNAKYVWGADGEVITEDFIKSQKMIYGISNYSGIDLSKDEGKLGFDCSGFLTPVSGKNITAASHYSSCKEKGKIGNIPTDKVCLIFREENGKVVHVGVYTGDGKLTEMWGECRRREFKPSQWTYYGIPSWIEYTVPEGMVRIETNIKGYSSANDAINGRNYKTIYNPGLYYVYRVYGKSTNISKTKGVPGAWVVI